MRSACFSADWYAASRSDRDRRSLAISAFILAIGWPRIRGICMPHHTCSGTTTCSQGGFPRQQSNPGRWRRNTSGNTDGKCTGLNSATAAAALGCAAVCTKVGSSRRSGRVHASARAAVITSKIAVAPLTACRAARCAARASLISAASASELRASRERASDASASRSWTCPANRLPSSAPSTCSASSMVPTPLRLSPHTRLWSRNDSGNPGTKVCTHSARRASSTAMGLRSTPYMQRRATWRRNSELDSISTPAARSPRAATAAPRSRSSSAVICGSGWSASHPDRAASIRSSAATRKWPDPIAMSAHRKSKNTSAAAASSPAPCSSLRCARCACSAGSRASSSRCSTQKDLVK